MGYILLRFFHISLCRRLVRCRSRICIGSCRRSQQTHKVGWNDPSVNLLCAKTNFLSENVRNGAAFRCIEAIGQAVSYGMNTQTTSNPLVGLYVFKIEKGYYTIAMADYVANKLSSCVSFALLGAALIPMAMLVNTTPDRIPADLVAEEQKAADEKWASNWPREFRGGR